MKQLYKVEGTFTDGSKYKNTVVAKNEQEAIEKTMAVCDCDNETYNLPLKELYVYSEKDIEDLKNELLNAKISKNVAWFMMVVIFLIAVFAT